ncbi:hypothetical protein CLV42_10820 [Chitinophaga ginsengisoli]|uniref:Uncharacterized protein n=1 Tax=Chitinophaga ginsengisoli TaxID=363837 RepID=A0A2P8G2B4_9BACT|nr:hypothetical protein CLV42_10820 [Chitinophaga ginsengisoli]
MLDYIADEKIKSGRHPYGILCYNYVFYSSYCLYLIYVFEQLS